MPIAPNDFTHLHVHSEFSLLDGLGRITELGGTVLLSSSLAAMVRDPDGQLLELLPMSYRDHLS